MSAKTTFYGVFNEDGTATIQGRAVARDGTGATIAGEGKLLQQADISTITIKVFKLVDPPVETFSATLTVSAVIFNTLQVDATWVPGIDSIGYTFSTDIPASAFPDGDVKYRAEVRGTTTGGSVFWGRWEGAGMGVFTS